MALLHAITIPSALKSGEIIQQRAHTVAPYAPNLNKQEDVYNMLKIFMGEHARMQFPHQFGS